jgi:PII-like signaling protein
MKKLQMTIYINEADMIGDVPLHEDIVRRLLYFQISGATVTRGLMGYGKHGVLHRKRLFGVSDDRPVVITSVDDEPRIRTVLAELRGIIREGLIVLQDVEVA